MTSYEKYVMESAIDHYGYEHQVKKAREELKELDRELERWQIWNENIDCPVIQYAYEGEDILAGIDEERADVSVILDELELMFSCADTLKTIRRTKIHKLLERIKSENQ